MLNYKENQNATDSTLGKMQKALESELAQNLQAMSGDAKTKAALILLPWWPLIFLLIILTILQVPTLISR